MKDPKVARIGELITLAVNELEPLLREYLPSRRIIVYQPEDPTKAPRPAIVWKVFASFAEVQDCWTEKIVRIPTTALKLESLEKDCEPFTVCEGREGCFGNPTCSSCSWQKSDGEKAPAGGKDRLFSDEDLARMAGELETQQKALSDYFESPEFLAAIEAIRAAGGADDEALAYKTKTVPGVDTATFVKVFDATIQQLADQAVRDPGDGFPTERLRYRGLEFITIEGQGTAYIIKVLPEDADATH